jgi:uncharacterized protein (DUF885 family)
MTSQTQKQFYQRVDEFFEYMMAEAPMIATHMGDHRYDDRLTDHSRQALDRREQRLAKALEELEAVSVEELQPTARIDHTLMTHMVRSVKREYDALRGYERSPGMYSGECLGGIFMLLVKDFAPLPVRMKSILGRLQQVPRVLAEGKANLVPERVPRVWAEIAHESATQGTKLFSLLLPLLSLRVPALAPRLILAGHRAAKALAEYAAFLKEEIIPRAQGEFAVGKDLFEEMLRENHFLDYTADSLLKKGWELFEETQAAMETVARSMHPDKTAKEILEAAKDDHPEAKDLLDAYRREVARARQFVIDHEIVSIPENESLRIEPTPAHMRAVLPFAAYMMPGPLEKKQEGIFIVTPVSPRAPKEAQRSKLRGHNHAKLPVTALHEAYPGHHLQLVYANSVGTLPRKLGSALSSLFVEGWAFYCEELMEQLGFIDQPIQKLGRLKDQLWRAARIILDVSLHTQGMTVEEGIGFLVDRVGLEPKDATAEVRRYTSSPTQPMSYLIGKLEILKVIEAYKEEHPDASLREMHDRILACGSLPPKLLAQELLKK